MYYVKVFTYKNYLVATFWSFNCLKEINAFYYDLAKSGIYNGYIILIKEK